MKNVLSDFITLYAVLLTAVIMSGCTPYEDPIYANTFDRPSYGYHTSGYNSERYYRRGMHDGCSSSKGNYIKDRYLYHNDYSYRNGWKEGYEKCRHTSTQNLFRKGKSDGCQSAKGRWKKDTYLYRHNSSYRKGWDEGYRQCRSHSHNNTVSYYSEGRNAGCQSAKGRWKKDTNRYRHNNSYRKGWDEGYRQCRSHSHNNTASSHTGGRSDGCQSAKGRWKKDIYRYRHNTRYRKEWDDGFKQCRTTKHNSPTSYYNEGRSDGCRSVDHIMWKKDEYKYIKYASYRKGWDRGYQECKTK